MSLSKIRKVFNLKLPPELAQAAHLKCKEKGIPVAVVIRTALQVWVDSPANLPVFTISDATAISESRGPGRPPLQPKKKYTRTECAPDEMLEPHRWDKYNVSSGLKELADGATPEDLARITSAKAKKLIVYIDGGGNFWSYDIDGITQCVNPATGEYQYLGKPSWWREMEIK